MVARCRPPPSPKLAAVAEPAPPAEKEVPTKGKKRVKKAAKKAATPAKGVRLRRLRAFVLF